MRKDTTLLQAVGFGNADDKFGPETGIGWALGDALSDHVLLLKIAWGGKSLAVDFRPPNTPKSCTEVGYSDCGDYFWKVVNHTLDSLASIKTVVQNYEACYSGYELAGLVYFQGWNDFIDQRKVDEYNDNLYHFMQDMRTELNSPALPVVIGELGMHGDLTMQTADWKNRAQTFRDAQRNATYFTPRTRLAETAIYVDWQTDSPCTTPALSCAAECECQGAYHYYNNAYSYYKAGVSMGNALIDILSN